MNDIYKFMGYLEESNFKEAAKVEAEIIENECKNSGICRNFLTCKIINNPTINDVIEREKEKISSQLKYNITKLNPIQRDLPYPNSIARKDIAYKNIEKMIIDEVNKSVDEAFLSKLDEKYNHYYISQVDWITPSALMMRIADMRSHGCEPYGAIWNSRDFWELMCDPNWKNYGIMPNNEYAGWQQDLLGIRNFNSPVVPEGKVYITTFPKDLGNAIICKSLTFSQFIKPMDISFSCSIDIGLALNNESGVAEIIEKQ